MSMSRELYLANAIEFCKCKNQPGSNRLYLKGMTGNNTPGYPVGVFNAEGAFIGFADDQAEFISLWNGDLTNLSYQTITAGPTETSFNCSLTPGNNTPVPVTGLRYWQLDYSGSLSLFCGSNDKVQWSTGGALVNASTFSTITTIQQDSGSGWSHEYFYPACLAMKQALNTAPSTTTVTVFHNEDSIGAGFNDFANFGAAATAANLRGNFPLGVKKIAIQSISGVKVANVGTNAIYNWPDLVSVESLSVWNHKFGAGERFTITQIPSFVHMSKLRHLMLLGYTGSGDQWQVTAGHFPDMVSLVLAFSDSAAINGSTAPPLSVYAGIINLPAGEGASFANAFYAAYPTLQGQQTSDCGGTASSPAVIKVVSGASTGTISGLTANNFIVIT